MTALTKKLNQSELNFDFLRHAHVWASRAQQRKELADIPNHLLADMGVTEAECQAEANKPFWKA